MTRINPKGRKPLPPEWKYVRPGEIAHVNRYWRILHTGRQSWRLYAQDRPIGRVVQTSDEAIGLANLYNYMVPEENR